MRSYLRFEVKGLNGAAVQSAKLQVYANSSNNAGYTVKAVSNNSWSEKDVTYSNAPGLGGEIKSIGEFDSGKYTEVDISSYIRGEGTFSLALVARNSTQTNLASREDGSHAPKLVLTLSSSQPPPSGPTGVPTQPPATQPAPTQPAPTSNPTQPAPGPTATPGATQPVPTQAPSSGSDPIIFFQGDLVSGSSMARTQKVVSLIKNLMAQHPGTQMLVASTGDNEQENTPTLSNYQQYFGTTYGTFVTQGIFRQVRGNHDVQSPAYRLQRRHATLLGYCSYFGAKSSAKLPTTPTTWAAWHIVGLDQLNGSVNTGTL